MKTLKRLLPILIILLTLAVSSFANSPQSNTEGILDVIKKDADFSSLAKSYSQFGWAAYKRKDYKDAVKWFYIATLYGDADDQYNLGSGYANGLGPPQDGDNEAIQIWKLAAEQGNPAVLGLLGAMYHHGSGVSLDNKEAFKWFRLAAEQGLTPAKYSLGVMYKRGLWVPQDYKEAIKWFRLAAEEGHASAQYDLGERYANGQGVSQDYKEAVKWLHLASEKGRHPLAKFLLDSMLKDKAQKKHRENNQDSQSSHAITFPYDFQYGFRAFYRRKNYKTAYYIWLQLAERGDAKAQLELGAMYEGGLGVTQDYVKAHKWYNISGASENEIGRQIRDIMKGKMTSEQIKEAQKLAREWVEEHGRSNGLCEFQLENTQYEAMQSYSKIKTVCNMN